MRFQTFDDCIQYVQKSCPASKARKQMSSHIIKQSTNTNVNVSKGQVVSSGDKIGAVGLAAGDDAVPILHFAVRKGKSSVDPMSYFKSE